MALAALGLPRPGAAQERAVEPQDWRTTLPTPRHHVCYRAPVPPAIDGRLADDPAWVAAAWTEPFVDIEGAGRAAPRWRTRAKMLWDDQFFYVAAELEEPHVWGTITRRDAVIFHDNDFEIFIDPDGDTHAYYELEINALGTVWDLFLPKPYRDGGSAVNAWDIAGLQSAVAVQGTLNDPSDQDVGWTVELAIPWAALAGAGAGGSPPRVGDQWRVNFSRVQWQLEVVDGAYRKKTDLDTGRPLAEDNWVWSPQGAVNMHMPEMWGIVQFSSVAAGRGRATFRDPSDDAARWVLRRIYYAEREFYRAHGRYGASLADLGLNAAVPGLAARPLIELTALGYEAWLAAADGGAPWRIRQDGRLWRE